MGGGLSEPRRRQRPRTLKFGGMEAEQATLLGLCICASALALACDVAAIHRMCQPCRRCSGALLRQADLGLWPLGSPRNGHFCARFGGWGSGTECGRRAPGVDESETNAREVGGGGGGGEAGGIPTYHPQNAPLLMGEGVQSEMFSFW